MKLLESPWLHPLLFAAFPITFLLAHNIGEVGPREALLPLGVSLGGAFLLWLTVAALSRNTSTAGLISSFLVILFFSLGQFMHSLPVRELSIAGRQLDLAWVSLGVGLLVAIFGVTLLRRIKRPSADWHQIINVMALLLVGFQVVAIARTVGSRPEIAADSPTAPTTGGQAVLPDIFHIVFDGYGREDVTREIFGHDGRPFVAFLEDSGFYVAHAATANYPQTILSLLGTFGLEYLDPVAEALGPDASDREILRERLLNSRALESLRGLGYQIIAFDSGYYLTQMTNADKFVSTAGHLNNFNRLVIESTPLEPFTVFGSGRSYHEHRRRITDTLSALPRIERSTGAPRFVFAHVLAPHPPFVFGPEGEFVRPARPFSLNDGASFRQKGGTRAEYREGYVSSVRFLDARLRELIPELLEPEARPVVIILQGDHGSGVRMNLSVQRKSDHTERFSVLSAVFFEDGQYSDLYPEISLVNTYRVIGNKYFGESLDLLEDRNYFSTWEHPLRFVEVTQAARQAATAQPQN